MMTEEFISVGKIINTQGNSGAVRVLPLTDYPERFSEMNQARVSLNGVRRQLLIEEARTHKKFIILKFKEINTMKAAEELKGGLLEVTREELVPLPEGSFYIFDIIGMKVFNPAGECLGKITEVIHTGANDVYVTETGGKPILIPAIKQVVKEIDLPARRILVELPEGLLDP